MARQKETVDVTVERTYKITQTFRVPANVKLVDVPLLTVGMCKDITAGHCTDVKAHINTKAKKKVHIKI